MNFCDLLIYFKKVQQMQKMERQYELTPEQAWKQYINEKITWLRHYYIQAGWKGQEAFRKAVDIIQRLEQKLKASPLNKNDQLFKSFTLLQKAKYYRRLPYSVKNIMGRNMANSQLSIRSSDQLSKHFDYSQIYMQALYANFKSIINVLTLERYSMSNIAKHIIRRIEQDEHGVQSLIYDVERGLMVDWRKDASEGLFCVFLRSISKGIIELEQNGILHLDIQPRNILLYNCQNIQHLADQTKIFTNKKGLEFKIIDFESSILVGKYHLLQTIQMFEIRNKVDDLHRDVFFHVDVQGLKSNPVRYMKQEHSKAFANCYDNIVEVGGHKIRSINQCQQWKQLIISRRYQEIITKADQKINQIRNQNVLR